MRLSSTTTRAITSAAARGPRIPIWSSRSSTVTILRPARARTALPICNLRNIVPGARFAATTTGTAATAQPFDISSNMASAKKIQLSPQTDTGVWSTGVVEDSARTASEVLQEDLEKHHVYFNDMGFHNHIVHHILTIYALGASPSEIKAAYDRNKAYQRPPLPVDENVVQSLHDKVKFKESLGKQKNYPNFLEFFQGEIEQKGVEGVLGEYVFSGDENAESMLARLFGGLLHPIIHLGFAIEFNQPALIAEALAQTAIHEDWTGPRFLWPAEEAAGGIGKPGKKTMLQLLKEARADKKLASSVLWEDGNKLRDGVLKRAPEEMLKYASQYTVSEEQIQEKFVEMVDVSVYFSSACQRPSKEVKFDFFYIHTVNSSIFYSKILALPFLDTRTKLRLLEWKGRMDLLMYISRNAPELYLDEITRYPIKSDWDTIITQSNRHPHDDGHLSKLVRALRNAENICRPYEGQEKERGLVITGDSWLKIGNMVSDSVKGKGETTMWIRSTGFDEAWEQFDDRARL